MSAVQQSDTAGILERAANFQLEEVEVLEEIQAIKNHASNQFLTQSNIDK